MRRRSFLRGYFFAGVGVGLLIGQCVGSVFLCTCAGVGLILAGLCAMKQK